MAPHTAQIDTPAGSTVVARGIVKRFGDLTAVDGIDLEVEQGTCVAVLGPNGAGKTTTIEMLEGIKQPDAGEIVILGRTWQRDARAIRERIGVQLQETEFQDKLKVYEILRLFNSFYAADADLNGIIDTIGLEDKRDSFVKTLSGGQKQRLSIGCALLHGPEILFLDEPTTGLDPQARRRVWEVVERFKTEGGTVLMTTHYMEEAERLADLVVIVDKGRVITRGSPAEIIASLGAESLVRFSLIDEDVRVLAEEELLAMEGVTAVRYEGADIVLSVERTQAVIASLFSIVESRRLGLEDLRTHRPTLEDVFVSLTGRHLRDG
ncbi:MAG: ABC transporter ATP-binding protein [Phycisphaera sp.]|nr:MAG: ABC transporter ATP-binding protein [Phycisphaera sp.]